MVWHSARVRSPASDRPALDRVVLAGLSLIVLQLCFRAWFAFRSWFQFDDLVFLTRVNDAPLSADLLLEGYGGHFMPAGFALTWLFGHEGSLSYAPFAATLVVLQGLASLGVLLLLRSLFGSRWAILVPLSLYLCLAITFPAFIWWAAGVNQLALQIALGWGLWAHLTYLRTRQLRWALATTLVLCAGLAFYEKVLLVYGAIAVLTLAYFTTGSLWQRTLHVLRTYRPAVLLHTATGLVFIGVYLRFAFNFGDSGAPPGLELVWNMAGEALVPATVGGPLDWYAFNGAFQLPDAPGLLIVVSWVAVIALVIHLATTTKRSLRAWALPLFFLGCSVVLLGTARAGDLGPAIGLEFRYLTELGLLVPLALGLARLPVTGALESALPRPDAASPILQHRGRIAAATAGVAFLGLFSTWHYATHWVSSDGPRDYFANADRTLGTSEDPTPLINVSVPEYIMWGYEYPLNTTRHVLRTHAARMTYPAHSIDSISAVADDGTVRPVGLRSLHHSRPTDDTCGFPARPGRTGKIPLDSTVNTEDLWVRIAYHVRTDTRVTVKAGDTREQIDLAPGLHNVFLHVTGTFSAISVSVPENATGRVCLYDADVGVPAVLGENAGEESG